MKRICLILCVAVLIIGTICEDDHDHDHDHDHDEDHDAEVVVDEHEHSESLITECEEDGNHKYCLDPDYTDPDATDHCFDISTTAGAAKYCNCTDGDNGSWNATSKSCESEERASCDEYKDSLRSFYNGVCYTKSMCEAKDSSVWMWIDNPTGNSICAPKEAICAGIADTNWENDECTCTEADAEYHIDHCHAHHEEETVSTAAKWGYGIIATSVVSAFAVIGVLIVLMRHKWWYSLLLSTMVALAMGCLLSDATLHLIPLALGIHSHDDEDGHDHGEGGHGEEEEEISATERRNITIAITFGVYLFLLFEKLLHFIVPHQHSHGGESEVVVNPNIADTEMKVVDAEKEEDVATKNGGICAVDSVAWMIIIGDALHNFADGLVMGASFTNSLATGLGTSIAVLCHEVPHELGDFAVLLNAGMKIKFAVLFNFLSACTCFLGLFVGLAIGEDQAAQRWIFAFTAGMFIYIACADLIPEMAAMAKVSKHPLLCFVLQQLGVLLGFLIMYIIAAYEGDLEHMGEEEGHHHH